MAAGMTMSKEQRVSEAVRFLNNIHGGRQVRLAHAELLNRGKSNQSFTDGKTRFRAWGMGLENWLHRRMEKADEGVEIFYAPTPMKGDTGRKKFQVLPTRVAFSDADHGLSPEVKARLVELGACLVRSGGVVDNDRHRPKYHVYIKLSRDVGLDELEKINRGLKVFINGDKFDATSLLRIPGTRNHKYQGSPMVRLERLADQTHRPEDMLTWFPVPKDHISGVELEGMKLPVIPEGFDPAAEKPGYAKMRFVVKHWNQRWDSGNVPQRFKAASSIVKEAISKNLSVDEAYAFAMGCEPLLDKQADEGTYSIRDDVAKTYYRETKAQSSGLTVEEIKEEAGPDSQAPKEKSSPPPSTTPPVSSVPPAGPDQPVSIPFGPGFPFARPNLDELLSGDYKPLEPTLVTCGEYFLLYPGKSHGLSSDRGLGKTHVTIAMIHDIMKRGGRVAYFDFEDSADTFIRDRMMNQHGITEAMIRNQFLYLGGIDLQSQEDMEAISPTDAIRMMAEHLKGWDLVVVDGVSASMNDWSVDEDSPSPMLDGSKATDYAWWHNRQVKPFLDQGIATLQIDHSTKQGGRVGGTIQKGAKLTGVEYELRPEKIASTLVMGGTGRLILAAVKDRVGRIIRYKRRHVSDEEAEQWNDVAVFIMTSNVEGKVSHAQFEPINGPGDPTAQAVASERADEPLTESEMKVVEFLRGHGKPIVKGQIPGKIGMSRQPCLALITRLVKRGILSSSPGARNSEEISLSANAPSAAQPLGPVMDIDFSKAEVPNKYKPTRECRKCGDYHTYPDDFAAPDDIGYNPKRPMCKPCAEENIESESYIPRDGAEWARKLRGRITRRKSTRGDS